MIHQLKRLQVFILLVGLHTASSEETQHQTTTSEDEGKISVENGSPKLLKVVLLLAPRTKVFPPALVNQQYETGNDALTTKKSTLCKINFRKSNPVSTSINKGRFSVASDQWKDKLYPSNPRSAVIDLSEVELKSEIPSLQLEDTYATDTLEVSSRVSNIPRYNLEAPSSPTSVKVPDDVPFVSILPTAHPIKTSFYPNLLKSSQRNFNPSTNSHVAKDNFGSETLTTSSVPLTEQDDNSYSPASFLQDSTHYPQQSNLQESAFSPHFTPPRYSNKEPRASSSSTPFNLEVSEIGEPAFIVPDNVGKNSVTVPPPLPPIKSYGLTVNDGQVARNEVRNDHGEFVSRFTSADGTSRSDMGILVPTPSGGQVLVLRGSYSFTSPEGLRFRVDYTADERGYHATQVPVSGGRRRRKARQ